MKKAIIWRRGSTDRQEIETQDAELTEMAVAEHFSKKNLIHIGSAGASAIKQNDLYLQEVKELIDTLENDKSVKTVFVWEISRLARVELAFYEIKDYLIKNHVQLICKTPSLRLFDDDGKINNGTEITLSLLVTLAKQEMQIKQERFKRAKKRNKAEGKYTGGRIKIGYKLDKDKHFIVDDEKAEIIRNIYDWFVNDGWTLNRINNKLIDMGVYHTTNPLTTCGKRVGYLLRDSSYKGEKLYPRIVSDDIWEAADSKLKGHSKPYESKTIYFCKRLLFDTTTGTMFTAKLGRCLYVMRHKVHCINLNINTMDYIARYSANILLAKLSLRNAQENLIDYELKIKENEKMITIKEKQIDEHNKTIDRAINMNIKHPEHFSTEKMENIIKVNDKAIESLKTAITDIQTENARMRSWLNGEQRFINTISDDLSDEKKRELIYSVIERIEVTRMEKHTYRIDVKNKIGFIDNSWWRYKSVGNTITLLLHHEYGVTEDMTKPMKNHKRFERK